MENLHNITNGSAYGSNVSLDLAIVERMAVRFSEITGVYGYGLDSKGVVICEMTGEAKDNIRLKDLVGEDQLDAIFHRVSDNDLEVQAVEDTRVPNIKIAACSIHNNRTPVVTWIFFGVITDEEYVNAPGAVVPLEFQRSLDYRKFLDSVDVARDISYLVITSKFSLASAEAETSACVTFSFSSRAIR